MCYNRFRQLKKLAGVFAVIFFYSNLFSVVPLFSFPNLRPPVRFEQTGEKKEEWIKAAEEVIKNDGVFAFDLDNTLLDTDTKKKYEEDLKDSPLKDDFLGMLELGVKVGIVTANDFEKQVKRLSEGIENPERYYPSMSIYPAGGTEGYNYDGDSDNLYRQDKAYRDYLVNQGLIITNYQDVRQILEVVAKRYSSHLQDGELNVAERGLDKEADAVGMLAFKPFISKEGEGDIRNKVINDMKGALDKDGYSSEEFDIRPGGSTSINVTKKGMTKVVPLTYIIKKANLEDKEGIVMVYTGDEWAPGKGGDADVADMDDNVAKINVGKKEKLTAKDMKEISSKGVLTLSREGLETTSATAVFVKGIMELKKRAFESQQDMGIEIIVEEALSREEALSLSL